ncbi:MAG: XdhC family protein [Clostridium tyrobutyricum]|jgi:xanthine dehydrogenase accessory factor|uniref:XdhC family aldehyde oxidoreductase maturation factor n=1 Tax=Clostridium tyrobutyricum TaxID=1519 RepID=UPI0002E61ACB|nr:XdhC/CoxI family protein [Clostridium tyrobutyricum]MBV4414796.1 XdhC family protein [Clostridium tyrobutyricum]MBV4422402.1 XdhC family protein [Clostridium tyrobutyricum]MBV4423768.1 XdhC family protein [Clostridium tyrobutyricum]MCH4198671.1 XdhC family protein [Clostridium tyrobutyricum]MCH4238403.1 XdhC family protein [Clostridium tyrobutyricum]
MKDIYEIIEDLIYEQEDFVLATILEKSGSAPREQGTKMIIKRDFSIEGTIGGGIFEAVSIKLSSKVFENKEFIVKDFSFSNEGAAALGSVCGGSVKLLLEYIDCSDTFMIETYKKAMSLKKKGTDFVLVTEIRPNTKYINGVDKWICTETGFYGKENDKVQHVFRNIREDFKNVKFKYMTDSESNYLIEPVFNYEKVFIMGAGHISQKIATLTKMLDFRTIVLDDREEFANREKFKIADEIVVLESFENLLDTVKIDNRSYVIIVTRGHACDKEVLEQVLKTDARYIGMIGSKTKRNFVYNTLLKKEYIIEDIQRVHCPIGLEIDAQTPEEIAISIAAELIKVRRSITNEKE